MAKKSNPLDIFKRRRLYAFISDEAFARSSCRIPANAETISVKLILQLLKIDRSVELDKFINHEGLNLTLDDQVKVGEFCNFLQSCIHSIGKEEDALRIMSEVCDFDFTVPIPEPYLKGELQEWTPLKGSNGNAIIVVGKDDAGTALSDLVSDFLNPGKDKASLLDDAKKGYENFAKSVTHQVDVLKGFVADGIDTSASEIKAKFGSFVSKFRDLDLQTLSFVKSMLLVGATGVASIYIFKKLIEKLNDKKRDDAEILMTYMPESFEECIPLDYFESSEDSNISVDGFMNAVSAKLESKSSSSLSERLSSYIPNKGVIGGALNQLKDFAAEKLGPVWQ